MESQRRKERVALLSIVSNSVLVILKLIVGLLIGSISILSEAVHSATDLMASIIAWVSVRSSVRPPDSDHPFGHGKIENISGAVEALLIFLAAGWIIFEAIQKLRFSTPVETIGWGVAVMLFSALINVVVSNMLFKVAKETESVALEADAWHLRTDVYTSAGVMVSLAFIWVGQTIFPERQFYWLDPVAAMAVALLILKAAYDLTVKSGRDLLDSSLPHQEEAWIVEMIKEERPSLHGFHDLRTRKSGGFRFVEFHIKVNPSMTVEDSHSITERISARVKERFPRTSINIHIEPCDGKCEEKCLEGCLLPVKGDMHSQAS